VVLNTIWRLAATLGARSSFKRLPKRDVMGADIIQLCGLITEPAEPLALRLSSNLMVGVARYVLYAYVTRPGKQIYPAVCIKVSKYTLIARNWLMYNLVKHDIFLNDVNACFLSLKKAVRDLHVLSLSSSHLQMGQPIVRYVWHLWMSTCAYTPR
jgi:hypothetical protein